MDVGNVWTITSKEVRDALRNRWFLFFTVAFAGLALALSALVQPVGARLQLSSYSRTAASLINLVLLFVPLIGLTLGAANLAGDRETGALAYLLAQPVTRAEVLLGKYVGQALALFATLSLGFGVAGVALAAQGQVGNVASYLLTVVLACLLALAMLSVGFLLSTAAQKTTTAIGAALFAWLTLVFVGDLGIMGTAIVTQMPFQTVFFLSILNPLQLFKIASILTIQASLEVLGPAGIFAAQQVGAGLLPLLLAGLVLWIVVPLGIALLLFTRQERFTVKRSAV
jgi:Cu-processing system permease protein